jgi:hypothetical protein
MGLVDESSSVETRLSTPTYSEGAACFLCLRTLGGVRLLDQSQTDTISSKKHAEVANFRAKDKSLLKADTDRPIPENTVIDARKPNQLEVPGGQILATRMF